MILQAIERKVPEERLARALNIDMSTLRQKKRALHGVCPEAVEILKDKPVSLSVFALLKRMLPLRQIEAAEMMAGMGGSSCGRAGSMAGMGAPWSPCARTAASRSTGRGTTEISKGSQSTARWTVVPVAASGRGS
jgi:hypothetical protein